MKQRRAKKNETSTAGRGLDKNLCRLGVGVLSGGLMFVGQAKAGTVASESFESSPSALFGAFSSYAYSQNYTGAAPPGAGNIYYFPGAAATVTKVGTVAITGGNGASASAIDAGLANFNLSAFFSSYAQDTRDWSQLSLQFKDGSSANVGNSSVIGGKAFIDALPANGPTQGNGLAGVDWGQDSLTGQVPASARFAELTLFSTREAGNALDGYVDVVRLDVGAVPEPGSFAFGLGAVALLAIRRRRA
jgi:hypothetical protein